MISQIVRLRQATFGASVTDEVVGQFSPDYESARNFRLDMVVSSVTASTGLTAKLQHRALGGEWEDLSTANSSVSVTADGTYSIVLHVQRSADQADLPLRKTCRLVISTGAGDAVTFDYVTVQQV